MPILHVIRQTTLKREHTTSNNLPPRDKISVKANNCIQIKEFVREGTHWKITLKNGDIRGTDTWYVYAVHCRVLDDNGQPIDHGMNLVEGDLASRVVNAMLQRGYVIDQGPRHYNIVYLLGADAEGNYIPESEDLWRDRRLIVEVVDGNPTILGNWQVSSDPMVMYQTHLENPKGLAWIKPGQYRAWIMGTAGVGSSLHEALVQVNPVSVFRRYRHNGTWFGEREDKGLFGVSQQAYVGAPANEPISWYAGSLVAKSLEDHTEFIEMLKAHTRYEPSNNFLFRTTILTGFDL